LEKNEFKHKDLTEKIIGAAYTVQNKLGFGFLEKSTGMEFGLLINFGKSVEVRRKIIGKSE
jgi:hypothetical protein